MAIGRKLSNHNVFWKQKNPKIFFNYATLENFNTVWSSLTSQETAHKLFLLLVRLYKTWESFVFEKKLCDWLDNLFQVPRFE